MADGFAIIKLPSVLPDSAFMWLPLVPEKMVWHWVPEVHWNLYVINICEVSTWLLPSLN